MAKELVAGRRGLVVSKRPDAYEMTEPQRRFKEVLERCDIRKGITKTELMEKMKECIPREFRRIYGEESAQEG